MDKSLTIVCDLKTMPVGEWLSEHSKHGGIERKENEVQASAYHLFTLMCKCGASYVGMEPKPINE